MKRTILAAFLCLPLCGWSADTAIHLKSNSQQKTLTVEATSWRGEKALKIPVAFRASEWKKAGFPSADANGTTEIGWLYVTATSYQLQNTDGKALMGGPRMSLELDKSHCIVMRTLSHSVCGFLAVSSADGEANNASSAFSQAPLR